jgi:GNAT superfamily N-acetyltransferase
VRTYEAIERIDVFCDAVPRRRARADEYGPLILFVPTGPGWPYYARPRRGPRPRITAADIRAVRARQRELIIPESFEWIEQSAPDMAAAAAAAGLEVKTHPLMVLSARPPAPALPAGIAVRAVAPEDPELDRIWAVPAVAFGPDGPLAAGSCQAVDGVAEITGVGVLPSSRRRGLGAAITALLARDALDRDVQTVFLSASDDAVARVYARIGFREIGTAMIAEPPAE